MNRMIVESHIGADGVLRVPIGQAAANTDVRVTIEPAEPRTSSSEEYSAWLERLSGAWRGELERPPQLPLEERDPLS